MQAVKISIYLAAFVLANFIVQWFGQYGLIFTALLLIPFDFVMRCLFHEPWKGFELFWKLGLLVATASLLTYWINIDTKAIAIASATGFVSAQLLAGIFYQLTIDQKPIIKVNGSDFFGIIADSIVFQMVAFGGVNWVVSVSQIFLKIVGGIFWYYIIFHKYKLHEKW